MDILQLKEEAEPALKKHMEFIKSEMVWEISQELAADRQRQRDQRIAEARAAAPTNKPGGQEGRQEERRQEEDRQSAAVGRYLSTSIPIIDFADAQPLQTQLGRVRCQNG
ncbi:hypothetical protein N7452_001871 [Penicillium brevicompactum]|uniref:Uncharacterized protein n=1 Tax=Penicillium brevicompactum TaxID=5074 RepID=A0A9W9R379_PENBR|nr:hypothetical protein N7452_001871 [Penicillium brevicompactum]